ncbi:ankyrin repeat domain-containing protein [Sphingomonas sp. BIUV-7]|uniref:Ankyrin repeat domain-containing protein n=1 Tax=Sphingomonas natans TaxID=3063330 RepID=A0ABT8Y3W8_9SPHN|nr:ankyrin repeat domain-containing protein [Sphingomonas sp. BIUV-7]MDO6412999.1 ankyrin repeat domain-containing protein [Sphingomonas sp. BIUV-7]
MLSLVLGAALAGAAPAPAAALPPPERRQELLFEAAKLGRVDLIPLLVKNGADVNAYEARGFTPLILAAYNGQAAAVEALLAVGADPCKPDATQGNTAQMGVAFKGDDAIAARLLKEKCDVNVRNHAGQTALMMAALFARTKQIDMLLKAGADPAIADASGRTAAGVAAAQGSDAVAQTLGAKPQ